MCNCIDFLAELDFGVEKVFCGVDELKQIPAMIPHGCSCRVLLHKFVQELEFSTDKRRRRLHCENLQSMIPSRIIRHVTFHERNQRFQFSVDESLTRTCHLCNSQSMCPCIVVTTIQRCSFRTYVRLTIQNVMKFFVILNQIYLST